MTLKHKNSKRNHLQIHKGKKTLNTNPNKISTRYIKCTKRQNKDYIKKEEYSENKNGRIF